MAKVVPSTIAGAYASTSELNANFAALALEFENCLSLDGASPSALTADLDMNGKDIINLGVSYSLSGGYFLPPQTTTAALEAVANAINTAAGKVDGAVLYNTTTKALVIASGNTDAAVWNDAVGSLAHTPV